MTSLIAASAIAVVGTAAFKFYRRRRRSAQADVELRTTKTQADFEVPFDEIGTRLREVMDREGVAIVTNVISSQKELRDLEQSFVDDIDGLIDVQAVHASPDEAVRDAYNRFKSDGLRAFPYATARQIEPIPGFVLKGCVAAGSFAWRVRRHERVHAAFGALFPDAGPLVTSIDTTFFTPEGGPALDEYSGSAHVDQNGRDSREPDLKGASIYQGILYVWAADDGCTTTCVWPRSHTSVWPSMLDDAEYKEAGQRGDHYFEIRWLRDAEKRRALQDGWEREHLRLRIPAGALLLWNSRTVHTGVKSGPRFAQAVCLEPASKRPPQHRAAKMRLAALGLPSTHWARIGHQHDVLPDYEGYLTTEEAHRRETAVAQGDGTAPHRGVLLPLRPAIRPAPLADGADLEALRPLARIDWADRTQCTHKCVWDHAPRASEALLEASVRDDFKQFL